MRRNYLGEKAYEEEIGGIKIQWILFNQINDIIGSSLKVTRLFNIVDRSKKSKEKFQKKLKN